MKYLVGTVALVALAFMAIAAVYMYGLRTKNARVLRGIRGVNHKVFNPRQMASAGTPGAYASIVRHRGRVSGAEYETPIVVREYGDDLVVVLPYSTQADWVKNVLAAGAATIVHEGEQIAVHDPELVDIDEIADSMTDKDQKLNRMVGTTEVLRLRRQLVGSAS